MSNYNLADFELLNFDKYPRFLDKIEISRTAKDLYRILFNSQNKNLTNKELLSLLDIKSKSTLNKAKKELITKGLLEIEYSKNGLENSYFLKELKNDLSI